jgi:hypothetical protein
MTCTLYKIMEADDSYTKKSASTKKIYSHMISALIFASKIDLPGNFFFFLKRAPIWPHPVSDYS